MKRLLMVVSMVAVMGVLLTPALAADGFRFGVGAQVSYYQVLDDALDVVVEKNVMTYGDTDFDATAQFGGTATCVFNEYFSVEASLAYSKTNVNVAQSIKKANGKWVTLDEELGEVSQVPFSVTGRLHVPTGTMFNPYFGLGFGYIWNNFDESDSYAINTRAALNKFSPIAPVTTNQMKRVLGYEVDDDWEFHLGAGVEVNVTENVAVTVDGKYMWHSTDLGNAYGSADLSMDAFVMGAGLKYYF